MVGEPAGGSDKRGRVCFQRWAGMPLPVSSLAQRVGDVEPLRNEEGMMMALVVVAAST